FDEKVEEGQDTDNIKMPPKPGAKDTKTAMKGAKGKDAKGKAAEDEPETKTWRPRNDTNRFGGDILFRNALIKSLNVPAVKVIEKVGTDWAATYARRLGIFSPLNMDFTLTLGS